MVTGESLLVLSNGTYTPIEKLNDVKCVSIDFDDTQHIKDISGSIYAKEADTIEITLDSMLSVCGNEDSSVIVRPRSTRKPTWKQLKDIEQGDNVGILQELPYFGTKKQQDAKTVGIIIGGGDYSIASIPVDVEDRRVIDYVQQSHDVEYLNRATDEQNKTYHKFIIKDAHKLLMSCGIDNQKPKEKTLPAGWQSYDKDTLIALLEGIIESDGNLFIEENRKPVLYLTFNNEEIAHELLFAFMKLGIHGKIELRQENYKRYNEKLKRLREPLWILWIRGKENFSYLCKQFSFISEEKQKTLDDAKKVLKKHDAKIQSDIISKDFRFEKVVDISNGGYNTVYGVDAKNYIVNGIFMSDYTYNINGDDDE